MQQSIELIYSLALAESLQETEFLKDRDLKKKEDPSSKSFLRLEHTFADCILLMCLCMLKKQLFFFSRAGYEALELVLLM